MTDFTITQFEADCRLPSTGSAVKFFGCWPDIQDGIMGLTVSFGDEQGPLGRLWLDALLVADFIATLKESLIEAMEMLDQINQ